MDRGQLEKIIPVLAQKHNFRLEIVEKDYYLTLVLNNVESHLSDKLVLKGGTLLNKIHLGYNRLSEDLDFTYLNQEQLTSRSKRSRAIIPIRENIPDFLKFLGLKSEKPEGQGFNNSTQYVFNISYPSFISGKDENIKIEVSLRQSPIDNPVYNSIKHFYQDPFTGEDLIPANKILSLSLNEAVAEKLKAAITRRDLAIRDYYDLWYIAETNFDLDKNAIELLYRQVETDLIPVIRVAEHFDLRKVFVRFNKILKGIK